METLQKTLNNNNSTHREKKLWTRIKIYDEFSLFLALVSLESVKCLFMKFYVEVGLWIWD